MNRSKTLLTFIALLFTATHANAATQEEVRFESMETESGTTAGGLIGLLIDHDAPDFPLAAPGFTLTGPDVEVTAVHVDAKARSVTAPSSSRPVHEGGAASIEGLESRPNLHFWVTPSEEATVEVQHRACNALQRPVKEDEPRTPVLSASETVDVDTRGAAQVASCAEALAVVEGDFSIVAWEWDVLVNGDRVNSGVNDTARDQGLPETDVGSADELHIHARDARLTIPLTAGSYELYIGQPTVQAREMTLREAEGRLPGLTDALDGEDVDLLGDYRLRLDATTSPFTATIDGTTTNANADGAALAVQVPAQPWTESTSWLVALVLAVVLASMARVAVKRYRAPLRELAFAQRHKLFTGTCALDTPRERRAAGLYVMAHGAFNAHERRRTHRLVRRAVRANPQHPEARQLLATALSELDRHQEAYLECVEVYDLLGLRAARAQIAFLAARSQLLGGYCDQVLLQHWLIKSIEDDPRVFLDRHEKAAFDPVRGEPWFEACLRRAKTLA